MDDEYRCTAKAKQTGERCKKSVAFEGTNVCRMHGGAAPQVRKAALKRAVFDKIEREIAELDQQHGVGMHPVAHLLHQLYTAAANAAVLGRQVAEWEAEDGEELHSTALWRAYAEERDRHVRYSKMAIDAGIAERQVQLAEQQAQDVADAIRAILADLGVLDDPKAPEVVRRHMIRLEPGTNFDRQSAVPG